MIRARIIVAAIRARRGAATVLFAVAVVAVAAAAIGPMFLPSADVSVLSSTAKAAPVGQSDVLIITNGGANKMSELTAAARVAHRIAHGLLSPSIFTAVVGSQFSLKGQPYETALLARTDLCGHLRLVHGVCPSQAKDVAISQRSATTAGVRVGDRLSLSPTHSSQSTKVTVVGIYATPSNMENAYWRGGYYFDYGTGTPPNVVLDPLVSSFATALSLSGAQGTQLTADVPWRASATRSGASLLAATTAKIKSQLYSRYGFEVTTGLHSVLATAHRDDDLMNVVVLAIVLQLILLSLVILFTLGRSMILERRQESEFARRHGFPRTALIALAIDEPAVLIVAALPVGVLVAWGALALLAKTLFVGGTPVSISGDAIAAGAGACVAGLLAMTIASSDLWRSRVANSRRTRRWGVAVDAFAVALGLVALVSLLTKGSLNGSRADPLAVAAPGLLALAAALVGLRLVALAIQPFIARTGASARVAWFLALRQIGRRPAVFQRLLPLTAATAVLVFSVGCFFVASSNRSLVAHVEVGAYKVVDVTPPPGFNFEAAVRRADPSGNQAMAAEYYHSSTGELLAVDASRLAAVANWPSSLSKEPVGVLAQELSPKLPAGVTFSGDALRLTIDVEAGTPPIGLGVNLIDTTYDYSRSLYVSPVVAGLHTYRVSLAHACPGSCRLASLAPNWVNPANPFEKDVSFVLTGVAVEDGGRWRAVKFGAGERGSWKAVPSPVRVELPSTCCSVAFDIPGNQLPYGGLLLIPVDLPAAIPAVVGEGAKVSDALAIRSRRGNLAVNLASGDVAIHPEAVVATLPFIGRSGAMVDLALAERAVVGDGADTTYQVWLAPSASPAILRHLRSDGVTIGPISTVAARLGVLDHSGIALAYAVAMIVAPIAALLALGTVAFVVVADGRRRRREIAALSMTGVPAGIVRRAYVVENALALGLALVLGAAVGLASASLTLSTLPQFVNGTSGLLISRSVPLVPFLASVGILAILLALCVEASLRSVMRGTGSRFDSGSAE